MRSLQVHYNHATTSWFAYAGNANFLRKTWLVNYLWHCCLASIIIYSYWLASVVTASGFCITSVSETLSVVGWLMCLLFWRSYLLSTRVWLMDRGLPELGAFFVNSREWHFSHWRPGIQKITNCIFWDGTIQYDMMWYFNLRSKADISRHNLPHGIKNWKVEKRKSKNGYAQKYR